MTFTPKSRYTSRHSKTSLLPFFPPQLMHPQSNVATPEIDAELEDTVVEPPDSRLLRPRLIQQHSLDSSTTTKPLHLKIDAATVTTSTTTNSSPSSTVSSLPQSHALKRNTSGTGLGGGNSISSTHAKHRLYHSRRSTASCYACRKRKIKCDAPANGAAPCTSCIQAGLECRIITDAHPSVHSSRKVTLLEREIEHLNEMLQLYVQQGGDCAVLLTQLTSIRKEKQTIESQLEQVTNRQAQLEEDNRILRDRLQCVHNLTKDVSDISSMPPMTSMPAAQEPPSLAGSSFGGDGVMTAYASSSEDMDQQFSFLCGSLDPLDSFVV